MAETIDLTFLGKQIEKVLTRTQNAETLSLQNIDYSRRLERQVDNLARRLSEQKDDIELIVKAELMGRLTNFETKVEQLMAERFEKFESDLPALIASAVREALKGD